MPKPLRGPVIALIVAGILALAFMGFGGMKDGIDRAIKKLRGQIVYKAETGSTPVSKDALSTVPSNGKEVK